MLVIKMRGKRESQQACIKLEDVEYCQLLTTFAHRHNETRLDNLSIVTSNNCNRRKSQKTEISTGIWISRQKSTTKRKIITLHVQPSNQHID